MTIAQLSFSSSWAKNKLAPLVSICLPEQKMIPYIWPLLKHSLCTKFEQNPDGVVQVTAPNVFISKMAARLPLWVISKIYLMCIILGPNLVLA